MNEEEDAKVAAAARRRRIEKINDVKDPLARMMVLLAQPCVFCGESATIGGL